MFNVEISAFLLLSHLQVPPARDWTGPSMGGNSASHTVWAMRSTFCVTLVMNLWDQRAGCVRRAWPGAASSLPAEVTYQGWWSLATRPHCDGHFLHCLLLSPLLPPDLHSSCYLTHWSLQPFHRPFVTFPSPALYWHSSFCFQCLSPTFFFNVEIHFMCVPWSYFLFMYSACCPKSLLNAVTCDIPACISSHSSLTLR